ncbi:MAG: molybdate ABC transporter substrate-binding protein [Saprospiraceae bacterium]|nr:molybdate ABC transporter substrate-binding protein [Saprospiraceae bacterium]
MTKLYWVGLILLFLLFPKCSNTNIPSITVAAAASTQFVLAELIETFENNNPIKINTIISSSGKLTAQIEYGADVDIFISANKKYTDYLFSKNLAISKPLIYAHGNIVLWTYKDLVLDSNLNFLTKKNIKNIAIADPQTAPYGELSLKILRSSGVFDLIKDKIVLGESISQVNQYITTQSVDVGLTSKSVVLARKKHGKGKFLEIPDFRIKQSMILIKQKEKAPDKNAQLFYDFLQSETGKSIFKNHGYDINK